ncbi:hypothetical protein DespoDRAFT_01001 [Desulfobacter postgatei 2ac9]|uniref:Uncharacterized protein n=1 Tax=Desulfobacter postgatei 2ac9 TaxID=879212 RepID=I5B0G3_9BACT|nr:hypothetical protein DespoDRAFT_01001 [Desulfobacter postgatei 2ac9]
MLNQDFCIKIRIKTIQDHEGHEDQFSSISFMLFMLFMSFMVKNSVLKFMLLGDQRLSGQIFSDISVNLYF